MAVLSKIKGITSKDADKYNAQNHENKLNHNVKENDTIVYCNNCQLAYTFGYWIETGQKCHGCKVKLPPQKPVKKDTPSFVIQKSNSQGIVSFYYKHKKNLSVF